MTTKIVQTCQQISVIGIDKRIKQIHPSPMVHVNAQKFPTLVNCQKGLVDKQGRPG